MLRILCALVAVGWLCLLAPRGARAQGKLASPLFAFENCVRGDAEGPEERARLLASLGFQGTEKMGLDGLPELLSALDRHRLRLQTIYLKVDLDNPREPFDPRLPEALRLLRGRGTMPWLYVVSQRYRPSAPEADSVAIPVLRAIADAAHEHGVRVMLYPHMDYWVESVDDAVRVAGLVNRRSLGLAFNLPHYLAHRQFRGGERPFEALVDEAMPFLFAVSVNGADPRAESARDRWKSFIQPLGEGRFDSYAYLRAFVDRGFTGPIGLQCYGIAQPTETHLRKSMETWRTYQRRAARDR